MGFDGFVVGDWNGHGQIKGCTNESCPQAINAGLDIFMVPTGAWKPLYENTIAQVKSGEISMARIDDAVARVLRVKLRAGLFDKPSPANRLYSGKTELIGAQDHREVARQAVRESLVLLKNKNDLLPLSPNQHVLITGDGADNIGKQSGGWSITWQGTNNKNADFPGATSIYKGLEEQVTAAGGKVTLSDDGSFEQKPDVAVVVFGEEPYAEGHGDRDNLEFERGNKKSLALLKSLKAQGINVVSVFISGRPMWVNSELNASDAFVAAWLPGTEGGGVADVLLKTADGSVNHDFKGKLSFSWPKTAVQTTVNKGDEDYSPLLPYGFGLTYGDKNILADNLDENSQLDNSSLTSMDILVGAPVAPWRLLLKSGDELLDVSSSTHEFGAIKYRTEDKVVQEDARQFNFNGSEKASAEIVTSFAEDTITYVEANGVISFDIKLNQALGNELSLAMCSGECGESINLANVVDSSLLSKWQSVSIDLKCFADKGVNFASLTSPFSLHSSGKASVSVSDIKFVPNKADEATLKCK
ncbi:putative glycoside hydrolase, partial [Pseudoalteromonas marina]|uniref:putative glycoside hydrolase n=1 Tax=Pseudoalteromonas marina TaxID=267375 RepID=UPI0035C84157